MLEEYNKSHAVNLLAFTTYNLEVHPMRGG
jgi:hypothetical protein